MGEQAEVKVGREVKFLEIHFADGESITASGGEATERFWEIVDQSASEYAKRGPCSICQNDEQSVMELAAIAKIDGSKPYTLKDVVKALSPGATPQSPPAKCPTCKSDNPVYRHGHCYGLREEGEWPYEDCRDPWHGEAVFLRKRFYRHLPRVQSAQAPNPSVPNSTVWESEKWFRENFTGEFKLSSKWSVMELYGDYREKKVLAANNSACPKCGAECQACGAGAGKPLVQDAVEELTEAAIQNYDVRPFHAMTGAHASHVAHWLGSNDKKTRDVKWSLYPIGMVQRWIERAEESEAKLAAQDWQRPLVESKIRDAVENYCGHSWPDGVPLPENCPECDKIVQEVCRALLPAPAPTQEG